ncbi:MAG: FG-GAP repeat domain-containing protein [Planctomycetota bacterium]
MSHPRLAARLALLLALLPAIPAHAKAPGPGGSLSVLSVDPPRHALSAPTAASIEIGFDLPLDGATLSAASVRVHGMWSGVVPGALSLADGGTTLVFEPSRPYFPGELITVILSEQVASLGGAPLSGGHAHTFWARSARGSGEFVLAGTISTRFGGEGLVQSYGIHAGDVDGDGSPDFSIPNEAADDVRVLLNDGCGRYGNLTSHPLQPGSTPSSNASHDLNGDGVMDFVTADIDGDTMSVLMGNGLGGYEPVVTYASGTTARGIALLDANADGHVDAVVANRTASNLRLFLNNGDGSFAAQPPFDGGANGEMSVTATDANNDGLTDLFVAHFFSHVATLLLGDGNGNFTLSDTEAVGQRPWKTAVGDVNGDGNVDFMTADTSSATMTVLLGDGAGGMTASATLPVGGFPTSVVTGDLEGDGDLDLVSSDVVGETWTIYLNDGLGNWTSAPSLPAIQAASCATLVDYDRDGFMDIVGVDEFADRVMLWRQTHVELFGTQSASCDATLRVDSIANSGGFGSQPAHDVAAGGTFHLGVTGTPGATWVLGVGLPVWPGQASVAGLFNISTPPLLLFSLPTNAFGESSLPLAVPPSTPAGLLIGLQVFVDIGGGWKATNPEVLHTVP